MFPGLLALQHRELDMMNLVLERAKAAHVELAEEFIDLKLSVHRLNVVRGGESLIPICTPRARLMSLGRMRLLMGDECAWLQGVLYEKKMLREAAWAATQSNHQRLTGDPNAPGLITGHLESLVPWIL